MNLNDGDMVMFRYFIAEDSDNPRQLTISGVITCPAYKSDCMFMITGNGSANNDMEYVVHRKNIIFSVQDTIDRLVEL